MKALLALLAACAPAVPDEPSFQQHVAPILAANCVRCHGTPAIGGAPPEFRLDTYGDHDRPARDGTIEPVAGAALYATAIALRVVDDDAPMPPRFPLDDYQIDTLARWNALGAPRGEPAPGNHAPFASVQAIDPRAIDLVVGDEDRDIVGGGLRATRGTTSLPLGLLRSGPNHIPTNLAPGVYELAADLDDGGAEITLSLGQIEVP